MAEENFHKPKTPSSMIEAVAYHGLGLSDLFVSPKNPENEKDKGTLAVKFHGGATYYYYNVPRNLAEGLLEADSAGRYFNALIKHREEFKTFPLPTVENAATNEGN
jgi:hypothetical protein